MKKTILIICLVCSTILVSATDYYISSSGSDSNSGTSSSSPWQTITKVNSMFSSLKSGDRFLFNRGEMFYGTIKITKSGSSGSPIVIGAYGTGDNPIISGFTTMSGWTNYGGGIYSKTVSSDVTNMVTIDNTPAQMGRYPNTGSWLFYNSGNGTSLTGVVSSSITNWTGAQIVIRKNDWTLDRCLVSSHSGTSLNYTNLGSTQTYLENGNGYFFQNDIRCVTDYGEWFHDGSTFYMYFGSVDPSSKTVKVATLNNLVTLSGNDYITIQNLSFLGCINTAILFGNGATHITLQNNIISYAGNAGIDVAYSSTYSVIDGNTMSYCNASGIAFNSANTTITNNSISNIGTIEGSVTGTTGNYSGIQAWLDSGITAALIQYNSLVNIGYCGITFFGSGVEVRNNFINNTNLILDDGGGIYTQTANYTGRIIDGNIVLNSVGNSLGTHHPSWKITEGIYLDAFSANIQVTNNTVAYSNEGAIKLAQAHNNTVTGNITFDNKWGLNFIDGSGGNIHDNIINNNIFFETSGQSSISFESTSSNASALGTSDYNYHARPIKDDNVLRIIDKGTNANMTLAQWVTYSKQDANSHKSPITITNASDVRFEYNASKSDKVISLNLPMLDIKGTKYVNSITLAPYTSVVLMVDPNPGQPVIPVPTGSSVENANPQIILMSFQTNLANIIPASSAFTVQVNGVSRNVSSASVAGKVVQLTMASPVIYGDKITLTYTQPASNPLQTSTGQVAASISAQTVTNNVVPASVTYVSSLIASAAPTQLIMTYSATLANIVPSVSAFSVMVNSISRGVNSVTISGTNIQLTLATPVIYGDKVTVAYTQPGSNPLQTSTGQVAASISAQTVNNNVVPVNVTYVSSLIANAAPTQLIMTYSATLANIVPSVSAFSVMVNSISRVVNSVTISGTNIQLTLATPVIYGDKITVAYTQPGSNPLQTSTGQVAASISAQTVNNNVVAVNVTYVSSLIANAAPTQLIMTYSATLANIVPSVSAFSVMVNSISRVVNSVTISGTNIQLTLAAPVKYGDVITVSYTKPSSNPLQSSAGSVASTISSQTVTNNVNSVSLTYVSSVIANATPTIMTLTYSLSLANVLPAASAFTVLVNSVVRVVNSVAISGTNVQLTLASPVVYGDVVTVAYTKPSANPLQANSNNLAETIIAQSVLNNCSAPGNQPPIISISSPSKNTAFTSPATITINVNATDSDGKIIKVEFFSAGTKIGESTSTPYSFTWKNVTAGTYSITAAATDNANSTKMSSAISVVVVNATVTAPRPGVITVSSPSEGENFQAPANVNITINANDPDGTISKVEYFSGSTKIGESLSTPYSFIIENAKAGEYSITAIASDNSNAAISSSSVNFTVSSKNSNSELINLYPNPSDGRFSIDLLTTLKDDRNVISIVNLNGKIVYDGLLSKEDNNRQFDISKFSSGIYILMISGQNILITKKIIKK